MAYQDGDATIVNQNGAKTVALPLQDIGNFYATEITRRYGPQLASYFNPIRNTSAGYLNHLLYSDDFSNAAWTKAATTGTANAATDPEGGTTATKLAEDNTNAAHNVSRALVIASGVLNFGALLKASERTYARLRINNGTDGNLAVAVFDLSAGTVFSGTGTIKKLLNGWFWCYVSGTATVSNSTCFVDLTSDGSTFSYTGTTGSGIYAWKLTCIAGTQSTPWPAVATTATTRAVTCGAVDPDDPLAFLVFESEPEQSMLEMGMAQWTRRYANVPKATEHLSTIALTKPNASALGTFDAIMRDNAGNSLGNTYAYSGYYFGNNEVYGPAQASTSADSGADTRVTCASHGFTTQKLDARAASHYLFTAAQYSVIDANTIDLLGINLGTSVTIIAKKLRDYTPGTDRIRTKITENFYLPGFTVGIATANDIPVPDPALNDATLLGLVISTTSGYEVYDADALDYWEGRAPIYRQATIDIDMATL